MRHALACLLLLLIFVRPGTAQDEAWMAEKCATYGEAWNQALDMFGSGEMNYAFMAGNENFIASGCSDRGEICPQSSQELEIANALSLAMINAGAASTFLPFSCPRPATAADGWMGPGL